MPRLICFQKLLLLFIPLAVAPCTGLTRVAARPGAAQQAASSSAYDRAAELLAKGQVSEAWRELNTAVARNPSDAMLYNLRGLAAVRLGDIHAAEESFRRVIRLAPERSMGYTNLATLLSETGQNEKAMPLFRAALDRNPGDFSALLGSGVILSNLQKYAEAQLYLEKAWRAHPGDFQAGYEYARVLRELKRPEDSRRILDGLTPPKDAALASKYFALSAVVAGDRGDALTAAGLYQRAYRLSPNFFDLYLSLVRATLRASVQGPGLVLPDPPAQLSSEQHFALGLLLASHGAYAQAMPQFEETLRMEPTSSSAAYNLVLCYRGTGNINSAVELAERELAKEPTAELHSLLGSLYEDSGKYLEALRQFRLAVEAEPANEQYYFDLGTEYLAHFTFGPAFDVFSIGSRKFPNSSRQFVGLGFAHYARREYFAAAESFLSALEIDHASSGAFKAWNSVSGSLAPAEWARVLPRLQLLLEAHRHTPELLYLYGVTLARHGLAERNSAELEKSERLLELSIRLRPAFAEAHLELGSLRLSRRARSQAIAEFQEAVRLEPDSEMAHYRLGQAYRDLGNLNAAQRELASYEKLTRVRRERLARSRSAIRQFVLAQGHSDSNPPRQNFRP
jgi:tetratricopeptide (TPR) repeat protein